MKEKKSPPKLGLKTKSNFESEEISWLASSRKWLKEYVDELERERNNKIAELFQKMLKEGGFWK